MEENNTLEEGLEEVLTRLRTEKDWSYEELSQILNDKIIEVATRYEIKKENSYEQTLEQIKREEKEKIEAEEKLKDRLLTAKDVKKWEYGVKYPDLDMLYILSELYEVSCDDLVKAKNVSYHKGFPSIQTIKWTCYFLNVSIWVGFAINILFMALAFIIAMAFFKFAMLGLADKLAQL